MSNNMKFGGSRPEEDGKKIIIFIKFEGFYGTGGGTGGGKFNQTGQSYGTNPASLKGKLMSLEVKYQKILLKNFNIHLGSY